MATSPSCCDATPLLVTAEKMEGCTCLDVVMVCMILFSFAGLCCSTAKFYLLTTIVTHVPTAVTRPALATECNNFVEDMRRTCTLEFKDSFYMRTP